MNVAITPTGKGRRAVTVDGAHVGHIRFHRLTERDWWYDYHGRLHCGVRWLPEGVAPTIDGPFTPADAALLLLALHDYDRAAAIRALYGIAA